VRLTGKTIIGIIIIFIGLNILGSTLHLPFAFGKLFVPVLFLLIGGYFWKNGNRMVGGILAVIGLINLGNLVFDVNVAGLIIAVLMMYFGFRLFQQDRSGKKQEQDDWWSDVSDTEDRESDGMLNTGSKKHKKQWSDFEEDIDREIEKISRKVKGALRSDQTGNAGGGDGTDAFETQSNETDTAGKSASFREDGHDEHARHFTNGHTVYGKTKTAYGKTKKRKVQQVSSFLGDFIQQDHRFELTDLQINHFIGDVKIDLSKAIIPEGMTTIEINTFIGDVHIYAPYDLDVDVRGNVLIGDMKGVAGRQGKRGHDDSIEDLPQDEGKQVKIIASLLIGDIDVRYV
jgi:lia operon protein LiaF